MEKAGEYSDFCVTEEVAAQYHILLLEVKVVDRGDFRVSEE